MGDNPYSRLSGPDLDAYLEGRLDKMSDAGRAVVEESAASAPTPTAAPAMPMPGLLGATPSRPLKPPSGGSVTPEQIGTFAAEAGPPAVGQAIGATVGGMAPFPLSVASVPAGAATGAVVGKWVSNWLLGRGMPSPEEQAAEFKAGALTEVGGQGLTRGLPFIQRQMLGAPSASMSPATAEAIRLSDDFRVPLTGGQATGSSALMAVERVPSRFPIGSRPVTQFDEAQRVASSEAVGRLRSSVGIPKTDATATGETVGRGLEAAQKAAKAEMDRLYEDAISAAGGVTIPGDNRIKAAAAYLAKEGLVAPGLQSGTGLRSAKAAQVGRAATPGEAAQAARDTGAVARRLSKESPEALAALEAEIKANPDNFRAVLKAQLPDAEKDLGEILTRLAEPRPMTYAQTRDLYLRLGDVIDKVGADTYQGKRLIQLRSAISQDIKAAAQTQGGDFAAKLDAANKYAADTYFGQFGDEAFAPRLRQAAKERPEAVVDKILASDVTGITQIKRILSQNATAWKSVQGQVLDDLAARAQADIAEVGGQVGQRFSIRKWLTLTEGATSPYGPDKLKAVLEPEQYAALLELNRLFKVIEKSGGVAAGANPSGTAQGLLSAAQLNAILTGTAFGAYQLGQGDLEEGGAGLAGAAVAATGPSILARTLMAKGARDIIARSTVKAHGMAAAAARLAGAATRGGARLLTEPVADAMVSVPPMNPGP